MWKDGPRHHLFLKWQRSLIILISGGLNPVAEGQLCRKPNLHAMEKFPWRFGSVTSLRSPAVSHGDRRHDSYRVPLPWLPLFCISPILVPLCFPSAPQLLLLGHSKTWMRFQAMNKNLPLHDEGPSKGYPCPNLTPKEHPGATWALGPKSHLGTA